jgi:hypothetical protein
MSRISIGKLTVHVPFGDRLRGERLAEALAVHLRHITVDQDRPQAVERLRRTVTVATNATPDELAARVAAEIVAALRRNL